MATAAPTYHSNASSAYALPNDATEQDRLEMQSRAVVAMMKGECALTYIDTIPMTIRAFRNAI